MEFEQRVNGGQAEPDSVDSSGSSSTTWPHDLEENAVDLDQAVNEPEGDESCLRDLAL